MFQFNISSPLLFSLCSFLPPSVCPPSGVIRVGRWGLQWDAVRAGAQPTIISSVPERPGVSSYRTRRCTVNCIPAWQRERQDTIEFLRQGYVACFSARFNPSMIFMLLCFRQHVVTKLTTMSTNHTAEPFAVSEQLTVFIAAWICVIRSARVSELPVMEEEIPSARDMVDEFVRLQTIFGTV